MKREDWSHRQAEAFPWLFSLAEEFTSGAYRLLVDTEVQCRDGQTAIRALLFGRVVSGTEALVLLARCGFLTEADVVFRSNLEALFKLAALIEDKDMFLPYLGEDYPRRIRAMSDIRELLAGIDPRPDGAVTEAELDQAIREIEQQAQAFKEQHGLGKLREVKTWDWVTAGKQYDFFHGKYLMHSNAAHHAARDLERRIVVRPDGEGIESISLGIESGSPIQIILDSLLLLARGISVFANSFGVEIPQALVDARQEVDRRFETELLV